MYEGRCINKPKTFYKWDGTKESAEALCKVWSGIDPDLELECRIVNKDWMDKPELWFYNRKSREPNDLYTIINLGDHLIRPYPSATFFNVATHEQFLNEYDQVFTSEG